MIALYVIPLIYCWMYALFSVIFTRNSELGANLLIAGVIPLVNLLLMAFSLVLLLIGVKSMIKNKLRK